MMRIVPLFISALFVTTVSGLSAQSIAEPAVKVDTCLLKPTFEPTLFSENFYVEGSAGAQILFSKNAGNLTFSERLTPSFSLSAGKWFSPFWGARLQLKGFSLNGFSTVEGLYTADPQSGSIYGNDDPVRDFVTIRPDGSYRHYIRYYNLNADFRVSLANLVYGYKEKYKWDVVPSVGLGLMHVMEYKGVPLTNSISTNFELTGKYQLNSNLDINASIQSTVLPDQFEGRIAGNRYESFSSLSVGVTYYFKKRGFKKVSQKIAPPVITIINETDTIYKVIKDTVTVFVEEVKPYKQAQSVIEKMDLKFSYDSVQLKDNLQEKQVKELAEILMANPNMKLKIIGHTCNIASRRVNVQVGMKRAEFIKERFIASGVPAAQLITESKGFDEPLVPNTSEENRAQNRRVELRLE